MGPHRHQGGIIYTGGCEKNRTTEKFFNSLLYALYSGCFLILKTTGLKFKKMEHVEWLGSTNWLKWRLRWNWSTFKALLNMCWLHWAQLLKVPRCLGKAVESLQQHLSGEKPQGLNCSNQSHALSGKVVTLQSLKTILAPIFKFL